MRRTSTETRKPARRLPLDQRAQPLMHQRCPLRDASQSPGLLQKLVVQIDRRAHDCLPKW
jgi:hypothetical protein